MTNSTPADHSDLYARPALRTWERMIDDGTALSDPAAFDAACQAVAAEERAAIAAAAR